jgi:hypothetical protein
MNDIFTKEGSKLLIQHISFMVVIKLLGKPVPFWKTNQCIKTCFISQQAVDG